MRKIATVLAIAVGFNVAMWTGHAQAASHGDPDKRHAKCLYESWNGRPGFTRYEVGLLLVCAEDHYPVPGGIGMAFEIADRESNLLCFGSVDRANGGATGVFQIMPTTWTSWWAHHSPWFNGKRDWNLHNNPRGCRANVMIAIREAHQHGWGPWS